MAIKFKTLFLFTNAFLGTWRKESHFDFLNIVNFILVYLVIKLQSTYIFYTYKETSQAAAVPTAAGSTAETVHGLQIEPNDSADSENKIQVCFIR